MAKYTATVQEAIKKGSKMIAIPLKTILIAAILLPVALLSLGYSPWFLLIFPVGMLFFFLYPSWATPRWRIWAYEHVNDIHQFQRSAELEGLHMRESHDKDGGFMNTSQKKKLCILQERFLEDAVFVDDYSIPDEIILGFYKPLLTLSDVGLKYETLFFNWNEVLNDRIVSVSYHGLSARTGTTTGRGSKYIFRFETLQERFEISLSSLRISVWKLDLLLYTYRGRYNSDTSAFPKISQ